MTNKILACTFLVVMVLDSCNNKPYKEEMISDDKEVNYQYSGDRGIRGDDGVVYYAEGMTVTAYNGEVPKWELNLEKACPRLPDEGLEILYMRLVEGELYLIFGEREGRQNSAKIDIRDGKAKYRCAELKDKP